MESAYPQQTYKQLWTTGIALGLGVSFMFGVILFLPVESWPSLLEVVNVPLRQSTAVSSGQDWSRIAANEGLSASMSPEDLSDVLTSRGERCLTRGDYESAVRYFKESVLIKEAIYPKNDPRLFRPLLRLASSYIAIGMFSEASKLKRRGEEIVAKVWNDTEEAERSQNWKLLEIRCREYRSFVSAIYPTTVNSSPWAKYALGSVLHRQSLARAHTGRPLAAVKSLRELIALSDVETESNPQFRMTLITERFRLAQLLVRLGRIEEANREFREALRLSLKYYGRNHPFPARQSLLYCKKLREEGEEAAAASMENEMRKIWPDMPGRK